MEHPPNLQAQPPKGIASKEEQTSTELGLVTAELSDVTEIVRHQSVGLVRDVLPVLRSIIFNFATNFAFLLFGQFTIRTIEWFEQDLIQRYLVLFYIMEGLHIFSFLGTALGFLFGVYYDFKTQRDIMKYKHKGDD